MANLMERDIDIYQELKDIQVLIRTNNLLLSRFILELSKTRIELGLPKRVLAFKFEILQEEYDKLVDEFGKDEVNKALYRLDRLLLSNKQNCPNNVAKYIRKKIQKRIKDREYRKAMKELYGK
jgi:hypothetical protein